MPSIGEDIVRFVPMKSAMNRHRATIRRWVLGAICLPAAALLAGCGTTMYSHARGSLEEPGEAPSDGMYALYQEYNPTALKDEMPLRKGDRLGFKTAQTGRIIAVAGENEWTFEDAAMVWKRKD